ncbi:alpha/beta fold hydrolase [Nonomuraea ceibae]|uniref:alpha/beta fold hydrolase n=1 Tax=Nonomuraea ceibae TaxID=1935170 RepID=UPI001C5F49D5|nr:alpha/beta fold hydrolase [Nonomuraea ceibae]
MFKLLAGVLSASVTGLGLLAPLPASAAPAWCPVVPGHTVSCGTLDRPLLSSRPDLGTTPVGYALVRRARITQPAAGTVMVNPGGPGASTIAMAPLFTAALASLLPDHDLLLIDTRGTGRSGPITCGTGQPYGRASADAVAACAAALGPAAAAYTSATIADDFEAVRAKLSIGKVSLYGLSYGSYLMSIYAQRHPAAVRSIVLSGGLAISHDPLWRDSAHTTSATLRRVCARSAACDGDAAVRDLSATAKRLRARPITVTADGRSIAFGETELAIMAGSGASSMAGAQPQAVPLLGKLPRALHESARGNHARLKELAASVFLPPAADAALHIAVMCNDFPRPWAVQASAAERERQFTRAFRKARGRFGAFSPLGYGAATMTSACLKWPAHQPHTSTGRFPDVPVLGVAADLDATTTVHSTRQAARQYRSASFLRVPNMGHVAEYDPSGCVTGITADFIRHGRLGDTSCLAGMPPVKAEPVP